MSYPTRPKGTITPIDIETHSHPQVDAEATALYEAKVTAYLQRLYTQQNLYLAMLWGVSAMLLSAILWAAVSIATGWQASAVALALGLMVGLAVRHGGKGVTWPYRAIGGACALFGCLLGNILIAVTFSAAHYQIGIVEVMSQVSLAQMMQPLLDKFDGIDAVFYGAAIYEGLRFSARTVTEGELERVGMA